MRFGALLVLAVLLAGCTQSAQVFPQSLILATTTSTKDSGLLEHLLPSFEALQRVEVKVVAVGSGRALELGRTGDADVVLSHAPPLERSYLANGSFVARYEVMFNQFLVVGPPEDFAGLRRASDVTSAFRVLHDREAVFISRGDNSGTHIRERELWALAGFDYEGQVAVPSNAWYRAVGQGMGATLRIASEQQAYTLSDDSTFFALQPAGLAVVRENEPPLRNQYSVLLVNATRAQHVKAPLAEAFAAWFASPPTQQAIAAFEVKGHRLFTPNAGLVERA